MRSPADASPSPSRVPTHGSGPRWFATPSPWRTCTPYSLPVSRRTQIKCKLSHLVHVPAHIEDQISTVFDLIAGVIVREPAVLLLVIVEGKAHTAVNPTLADLAQPPYSPGFGQGVCDLRQSCGVRDSGKAISLLGEEDARSARLQATYSWPFKITWAGKGGWPLILIVRWPQSGSRM